MKVGTSAWVWIAVIVIAATAVGLSLTVEAIEYDEAKLVPLAISFGVLLLAVVGLWGDLSPGKRPGTTAADSEATTGDEAPGSWRGYFRGAGWLGGFLLASYFLGFLITIPLFVVSFMRWLGTRWRVAIISAVMSLAIVYGLFEVTLDVVLYRGAIIAWLGL